MTDQNEYPDIQNLDWLDHQTENEIADDSAPMPEDPETEIDLSAMAPIPLQVFDSGDNACVEFIQKMTAAEVEIAGHVDQFVIARTTFDSDNYYFLAVSPDLSKGYYGVTSDCDQALTWTDPTYLHQVFGVSK